MEGAIDPWGGVPPEPEAEAGQQAFFSQENGGGDEEEESSTSGNLTPRRVAIRTGPILPKRLSKPVTHEPSQRRQPRALLHLRSEDGEIHPHRSRSLPVSPTRTFGGDRSPSSSATPTGSEVHGTPAFNLEALVPRSPESGAKQVSSKVGHILARARAAFEEDSREAIRRSRDQSPQTSPRTTPSNDAADGGSGSSKTSKELPPAELARRWARLSVLDSGRMQETIPSSLRMKDFKPSTAFDPAALLKDGLPVQFFSVSERSWDHRVLKTDNRKNFFYVLKGGVPDDKQEPIVCRIQYVEKIFTGIDAMKVCEAHAIRDPHLNNSSALVVQTSASETDIPMLEKAWVFMTPPRERLKDIVAALVQEAQKVASNDASGGANGAQGSVSPTASSSPAQSRAPGTPTSGTPKAIKAPDPAPGQDPGKAQAQRQQFWWRLEGVRVKDISMAFNHDKVELELGVRALDAKGYATQGRPTFMHHPIGKGLGEAKDDELAMATGQEVERLQALLGSMPPVDALRVRLVVLELALCMRWARALSSLFEGGLYRYVTTDPRTTKPVNLEEGAHELVAAAVPPIPATSDALDNAVRPTLWAAVDAARQIIDIDDIYTQCSAGKLLTPVEFIHKYLGGRKIVIHSVAGLVPAECRGCQFTVEVYGKPDSKSQPVKLPMTAQGMLTAPQEAQLLDLERGDLISIDVSVDNSEFVVLVGFAVLTADKVEAGFRGMLPLRRVGSHHPGTVVSLEVEVVQLSRRQVLASRAWEEMRHLGAAVTEGLHLSGTQGVPSGGSGPAHHDFELQDRFGTMPPVGTLGGDVGAQAEPLRGQEVAPRWQGRFGDAGLQADSLPRSQGAVEVLQAPRPKMASQPRARPPPLDAARQQPPLQEDRPLGHARAEAEAARRQLAQRPGDLEAPAPEDVAAPAGEPAAQPQAQEAPGPALQPPARAPRLWLPKMFA